MSDPKLVKKYRYKDGEKHFQYWQAVFYDKSCRPARKRISLRTKDETAASIRFGEMVKKVLAGTFDPWTENPFDAGTTVDEAAERYLADQSSNWSPSSTETYETVLRIFCDSLPPAFPIHGVRQEHILDFLNERDLAAATRRSYQDRLRIFFRWCHDQKLVKKNPVPDRGRGKANRLTNVPKYFTEEQYRRLRECISADGEAKDLAGGNQWLINAIEFALGTGMRRGEICALKWGAVDRDNRMIEVRATEDFSPKSGRERRIPLVGRARDVIDNLWTTDVAESDLVFRGATGGPVGEGYLSERFRFYRRQAELPENLHLHSLRHTFASWFVMRGGDLYRLKEIMGHADMKTTLKYAHLRPEALMEEMEKCFG